MMLKDILKNLLNAIGLVLVLPFSIGSWLEKQLFPRSDRFFEFSSQCLALCPGLPGVILRRCFYFSAINRCSLYSYIGFGSLITHRDAIIDPDVYIGNYNVLGTVHLHPGTYLASRVSIPSAGAIHEKQADGSWSPMLRGNLCHVHVGPDVWVGEGALVLADVARGSLVAAGSVVTKEVAANVAVGGNPAKVIKEFGVN